MHKQKNKRVTAQESIRKFCVDCMGGSYSLVAQCQDVACPLHGHRSGAPQEEEYRPPVRAIRRQCMRCCCGDRTLVRTCAASPKVRPPFEPCPLWLFRLGSKPEICRRKRQKAARTPLTLPGLVLPHGRD